MSNTNSSIGHKCNPISPLWIEESYIKPTKCTDLINDFNFRRSMAVSFYVKPPNSIVVARE